MTRDPRTADIHRYVLDVADQTLAMAPMGEHVTERHVARASDMVFIHSAQEIAEQFHRPILAFLLGRFYRMLRDS